MPHRTGHSRISEGCWYEKESKNDGKIKSRKEGRTDSLAVSDPGIPGSYTDQLSSDACSICTESV